VNNDFIDNKWIPALLSGEYKQGKKYLKKQDTFCCLGVAADLLKDHFNTCWRDQTKLEYNVHSQNDIAVEVGAIFGGTQILPQTVLDFIGLTDDQQNYLAERNDTGDSFPVIVGRIQQMQALQNE